MSNPASRSRFVAMLRAVNVGGKQIKMPALAALFRDLGYADVVTYIQSGNVVFTAAAKTPAALEHTIEQAIARELGLDVRTLVRTKSELARVLRANPFLATRADPSKLHVTFLAAKPAAALARAAGEFDAGADEFRVVGREVYVHCPNGYGRTKINNTFFEKRLQAVATTRNWNTVNQLAELVQG
jgi:uncharacterized protein (DUF1697 family)